MVRSGRLWADPGAFTGLRFDAPIEAGDSGGPVIDLSGRVIGVASRCGWKSFWNWASSVEILDGDPARLIAHSIEIPPGESDPGAGAGQAQVPTHSREHRDYLDPLALAARSVGRSVARVEAEGGTRAFAIAVAPGGLFVTKASEINFGESLMIATDAGARPAHRVGYDPDADLLLLRAEGSNLPPLMSRDQEESSPGEFVLNVAADNEVLSLGTISLEEFRLEETDARPFLGVSWRPGQRGGARITAVTPGTPAARAGMTQGDVIESVDGRALSTDRTLAVELGSRRVGDRMALTLRRDGAPLEVPVTLDRRQPSIRARDRGNTRSNLSAVLPFRTLVWQQDGVVEPEQCGSAVIDLDGNFLGMNAGRFDRTSTLVIPAHELHRRVQTMIGAGDESQARFDELAEASFALTEASGRIRLAAVDARMVGARRLAREIGNALTPDGTGVTLMADDRLRWDAVIEAPGTFEVVYFGSARRERLIRIGVGEVEVEALLAGGRHRKGITLGEVQIDTAARITITLEWVDDGNSAIPGSLDRIELRRLSSSGIADSESDDS